MDELVGRLEERQFSSLQDLALFFTNYIKSRPYIALRPSLPIKTAPKQWWRFLHVRRTQTSTSVYMCPVSELLSNVLHEGVTGCSRS